MPLGPRFCEALTYAATLHATQVRKGTTIPYVSHLLSVAGLALEHGADEDTAIGALLHDAVEDQGGLPTLDEIRRRFGPAVAAIVEGCTDAHVTPKPPWRARKEAYLAHLPQAGAATRLVSCADKLHNARAILGDLRRQGLTIYDRFNAGREGTLWYYRALVTAFAATGPADLAAELGRVVTELEHETATLLAKK